MSQLATPEASTMIEASDSSPAEALSTENPTLSDVLENIEELVPPLWPLRDYVAVNPFMGWTQSRFLEARQDLREVRDCDMLMPGDYYRRLLRQGRITWSDVEEAYQQSAAEYPADFTHFRIAAVRSWRDDGDARQSDEERLYRTAAEIADHHQGGGWTSHIVNDITRHCAAHFDEGQAIWKSPWREQSLYAAWRSATRLSWRMEKLGIPGFRHFISHLPETPRRAIAHLLGVLEVPVENWRQFLLCELCSVAGWASYLKYRDGEAKREGSDSEDLIGLLAIRLAYDVALAQVAKVGWADGLGPGDKSPESVVSASQSTDTLARYVLQQAAESAFRRQLCRAISAQPTPPRQVRKRVQMVFCIDVRSEVMRRHLESVSAEVETFGFAGFFGLALEYLPLGASAGPAQCPVLLQPAFRVRECCGGADSQSQGLAIERRRSIRLGRKLWKSFQSSAASCFSFVESMGLAYLGKLLTDSLLLTRTVGSAAYDGVPLRERSQLGPDLSATESYGLSRKQKIDLAESMLRNLGLTENFARMVVLCGHTADVVNNPYQAALDCGACGGHSGEPNARVAAALLNDAGVRQGLAERGIHLPADCCFVPAVHHTTTDAILFHDTETLPDSHKADWGQLRIWIDEAGRLCREERGWRLGNVPAQDMVRRSRDWSEVRPEWGLAGNAAFVVAPRSRTAGLPLGGRTFMHSYDHRLDPQGTVLELIMTAPMIVANWINLQYYASSVDNLAFGSGNKVMHNVVGQLGVLLGNGGDLMTGLPWQSVHDGRQFQHEPLRLLVVIEAPRESVRRIISQHPLVRNLAENGWLTLVVLDGQSYFRWTTENAWREEANFFKEVMT